VLRKLPETLKRFLMLQSVLKDSINFAKVLKRSKSSKNCWNVPKIKIKGSRKFEKVPKSKKNLYKVFWSKLMMFCELNFSHFSVRRSVRNFFYYEQTNQHLIKIFSCKNNSHTGNRTRAYRVKAGDPNH
jgi:hypothetical protein